LAQSAIQVGGDVMTQFYFIRHGEPSWELADEKRLKGEQRNFVPLTEQGILQATAVAQDSRLELVEIIISSPYTRALQTAAIISRERNIPLAVEYDLHEWLPDLTSQFDSADSVQQVYDDFLTCGGEYPEGETRAWETWSSIRTRVESVLSRYVQYNHVAVVCHGMVIKSLTSVDSLPYCGIVEFSYEPDQ
jgi:uncharacterized phosphatase